MNDTCLTNDWCKKVYENIESVNNRGWDAFRNVILDSTLFNTYVKFYANLFLDRLPSYMGKRLPKDLVKSLLYLIGQIKIRKN